MPWIKVEHELPDKPEVCAIASMLDISLNAVVGGLIRVWVWFDKHTTDGIASFFVAGNGNSVTKVTLPALPERYQGNGDSVAVKHIDHVAGVTGFGRAMIEVGWLEYRDGSIIMPKFDRHTSESAKARALTARRVAKHKATRIEGNGDSVTKVTPTALPKRYQGNGKVTLAALPRERERERERIENLCKADALHVPNLSVGDDTGGQGSQEDAHKPIDDCPHKAIIDLYHEILPSAPRVAVWSDKRAAMLRQRWREDKERQTLDWWRGFFEKVRDSDFLCGRVSTGSDRAPFLADLEWLVRPTNFIKVIEGRYANRSGQTPKRGLLHTGRIPDGYYDADIANDAF